LVLVKRFFLALNVTQRLQQKNVKTIGDEAPTPQEH
jgi:hypothetical protein